MIRARLASGELTTYIGPDPNGGHVIRTDQGDMHTVDAFTPEFGHIHTPQWLTSVHQGPTDGICSWPTPETQQAYVQGQLNSYQRIVATGMLIVHQGMYVIADSQGNPLKAEG